MRYPQDNYKYVGLPDNRNGVPSLHEGEFQNRKSSGRHPSRLRGKETRPPPYDGTGDWHDYAIQFELISELNGWDLITKGMNNMKSKGKLTITLRTALKNLLQKGKSTQLIQTTIGP